MGGSLVEGGRPLSATDSMESDREGAMSIEAPRKQRNPKRICQPTRIASESRTQVS